MTLLKKKIIKFFYKNPNLKTSSRPILCLQRIKHIFYWKMKFLKQATYIKYVVVKLSKFIETSMQASSDSFLFFEK